MYHVTCKRGKGVFAALRAAILFLGWPALPKGFALAVTAAILAGCAVVPAFGSGYVAPILAAELDLTQQLARTRCSINNLPVIEIHPGVLETYPLVEDVREHEQIHAARAAAYPGGCWAYMYRIRDDKEFRVAEQMVSFCAGAQKLLERNADPRHVWDTIVKAMAADTALTAKDNCVYKPW